MIRCASLLCCLSLLAFAISCDDASAGEVGAPCNTADDCEGELICDEHNGQASCQVAHGHTGTDGDASTSEGDSHEESESHGHGTDHGHDTEHETEGHDTDHSTTDHGETEGHDTEHGETEGHDTDGHETEGHDTDDGTSTGGDAMCEAFCGCMAANCSSFEAYPYEDEAACMTACESFDEATLACYGSFCEQAAGSSPDLAEHQCEHAWGELGAEKC